MIIKKYWFFATSGLPTGYALFDQEPLTESHDFIQRLRPAEAIVLGTWNEQDLLGNVTALGVCLDRNESGARIDWREVAITLKPNASGRIHWRSKPFFSFAASVIERYAFADLFGERFPDLEALTFVSRTPNPGVTRRISTSITPGYVYLIRSQYGFKIGKTVNMKSRTRLFEVKLPFPIKVEHYAWFADYSDAERLLHDTFREKRLEGEWFDLSESDIAHIKTLGKPATSEELRCL